MNPFCFFWSVFKTNKRFRVFMNKRNWLVSYEIRCQICWIYPKRWFCWWLEYAGVWNLQPELKIINALQFGLLVTERQTRYLWTPPTLSFLNIFVNWEKSLRLLCIQNLAITMLSYLVPNTFHFKTFFFVLGMLAYSHSFHQSSCWLPTQFKFHITTKPKWRLLCLCSVAGCVHWQMESACKIHQVS